MNLRKIYDSTLKKGDLVRATLPDGRVVEGKVTDIYEHHGENRVAISSGDRSYWTQLDNIVNLTEESRRSAREESHKSRVKELLDATEEEIADINSQIDDLYNDSELEEWYTLHPEYKDSGTLPDWIEEQIKELEVKKKRLEVRCKGYEKTLGIKDSFDSDLGLISTINEVLGDEGLRSALAADGIYPTFKDGSLLLQGTSPVYRKYREFWSDHLPKSAELLWDTLTEKGLNLSMEAGPYSSYNIRFNFN